MTRLDRRTGDRFRVTGDRRIIVQKEGKIDAVFGYLVFARWVHFASVFILFGGALFWFTIGHEGLPDGSPQLETTRARATVLLRIAAVLALVSGVAWLVCAIATMVGGLDAVFVPDTLRLFFFQTDFGPIDLLRLVLFVTTIAATLVPLPARLRFAVVAVLGACLLVTQAWLGHAAEGGDTVYGAIMIVAYGAHVLAAAAWLGGLPPLLLMMIALVATVPREAPDAILHLLGRYSIMAIVAVIVIVLSGMANASFRVGGAFMVLASTRYGDVLFTKIVVVAAMLALASYNRFVLMPRLRRAGAGRRTTQRLRISVASELGLGLLVLGVAAVLGITPPPQ